MAEDVTIPLSLARRMLETIDTSPEDKSKLAALIHEAEYFQERETSDPLPTSLVVYPLGTAISHFVSVRRRKPLLCPCKGPRCVLQLAQFGLYRHPDMAVSSMADVLVAHERAFLISDGAEATGVTKKPWRGFVGSVCGSLYEESPVTYSRFIFGDDDVLKWEKQ